MLKVAIVMGSDSDEKIMRGAADALAEFGIDWEMRVISAHRTPDDAIDFARGAAGRGIGVLIAGAGGAAHLPGVLAALTPLPVIGVPVALANLGGLDSLLSIVQMPRGIPVATVAIDSARNAGLLAVRILAVADPELQGKVVAFQEQLATDVRSRDAALQERLAL
jgi:5-(carboxyamino)imidazole ribonucleotide mutase